MEQASSELEELQLLVKEAHDMAGLWRQCVVASQDRGGGEAGLISSLETIVLVMEIVSNLCTLIVVICLRDCWWLWW
eukprot:SAG11_NODE_2829_length_2933_cov_1.607975_1_plen_77_part_00